MKKALSVILSLVMAFTAICAVAALPSSAADGYKNEYRDRATWYSPFYGRWSFNAGPITAYVGKSEIDKFVGEGGIGAYSSRPKELPVIYLLIKHFEISKEQFTTAVRNGAKDYLLLDEDKEFDFYSNCSFTDEMIEILYSGDEDLIKQTLHRPTVFYYKGQLYTFKELRSVEYTPTATLREMQKSGGLDDYLHTLFVAAASGGSGGDVKFYRLFDDRAFDRYYDFFDYNCDETFDYITQIYKRLGQEPPFDMTVSPDYGDTYDTTEKTDIDFSAYRRFYDLWSVNIGPIIACVGIENPERFLSPEYAYTPESEAQLPLVYRLIKRFRISKDRFKNAVRSGSKKYVLEDGTKADPASSCTFTDEIIEILYSGDEDLIKRTLHRPTVFYYKGQLYTFGELMHYSLPLEEMQKSGGLDDYLQTVFITSMLADNYGGLDSYGDIYFHNYDCYRKNDVVACIKDIYKRLGQEPPFDMDLSRTDKK